VRSPLITRATLAIALLTGSALCQAQPAPSHELFDQLLKKNVTGNGHVNYPGFIKDSIELNIYLRQLSKNPPQPNWSRNEVMAFWINAYNAFTIQLITRYYPVKSIKDIGSRIQVPFVNSPWDIKFITIGKERLDLNTIEHVKLRKQFDDPRLHMALVCASKSCPVLLRQAYTALALDRQLDEQTRLFLEDPARNRLQVQPPQISMIFNWYEMDFKAKHGSVIGFINAYSKQKIKPGSKISYLEYDWGLNE
jgi:hypothetical protein